MRKFIAKKHEHNADLVPLVVCMCLLRKRQRIVESLELAFKSAFALILEFLFGYLDRA